jgi:hypothetical protein
MDAVIQVFHWLAGFIVLAEALNKLERVNLTDPSLAPRERLIDALKAIAWALMALGSAGALANPVLSTMAHEFPANHWLITRPPTPADTAVLLGFALLIVRTRLKEDPL